MSALYDIALSSSLGNPIDLNDFYGSPLLIVNVASHCGLTPQYAYLQELYRAFPTQGLNILACPCNQFANQEPDSSEHIHSNITRLFNVTFPLSEKLSVNGPDRHALYRYLVANGDDVEWNFAKFLLDGKGQVVARYVPTVSPTDNQIIKTLHALF